MAPLAAVSASSHFVDVVASDAMQEVSAPVAASGASAVIVRATRSLTSGDAFGSFMMFVWAVLACMVTVAAVMVHVRTWIFETVSVAMILS